MLLGRLKTTISQGDNRTHKFTNIVLLVPMVMLCTQTLTHLKLEFAASSAGEGPDAPLGSCSKIGDL